MKFLIALIAAALLMSLSAPTYARETPPDPPKHDGKMHRIGSRDCTTVLPERKEGCEARNKAMQERLTKAHDCEKAPDDMKARCETRNKAIETCKDKAAGKDHQACMMEQRPKK